MTETDASQSSTQQIADGRRLHQFMVEIYGGDDEKRAAEVSRMLNLSSLQVRSSKTRYHAIVILMRALE